MNKLGIMKQLSGLKKEEKVRLHNEYLEIRDRIKKAQEINPPKRKRKKSLRKNGKVVTYHISELEKSKTK